VTFSGFGGVVEEDGLGAESKKPDRVVTEPAGRTIGVEMVKGGMVVKGSCPAPWFSFGSLGGRVMAGMVKEDPVGDVRG